jgi:hypothetical protein
MSSDIANNDGMLFTPNYMHRGIDGIGVTPPATETYDESLSRRITPYLVAFPGDRQEYSRINTSKPGFHLVGPVALTVDIPKKLLGELVVYMRKTGSPTAIDEEVKITGRGIGAGQTTHWVIFEQDASTADAPVRTARDNKRRR